MPRISAPTVAEHRAAQKASLLAAAEAIIHEQGIDAVNPRSVGERAGLARSSVYEYFRSRDDILAAVAIQAIERWNTEIEDSLTGLTGRERLSRFVHQAMRLAADGHHDLATRLSQAELAPTDAEEIKRLHRVVIRPLELAFSDVGVDDPMISLTLAQGLLNAGIQLVGHGAAPETVAENILGMITAAITS
ncbi:TetR/AcrR family transcriptional regulator [uncultured Leifsonia sp.]|uniref:TetR/AcrR family transcriptional regulator n=1 Tax=uncultured Leifsonia sp. TaxID=340359 RepID=UPI0025F680E2|nr:TetR/AcrR family transcriptional regulator [uncultured Leifsonia sp.]